MGRREERKEDNRRHIVDAARKLMQARNTSGFSMRTLAEVAGVSIATPYNLFGSKQAIIAAVMDTDLDDFQAALMAEKKDPLDVFFHCVDICADLFSKEPGYYKAGTEAVQSQSDSELAVHFGLPRHALMRDLVANAVQKGYLIPEVDPDSLAIALGQQFFGWILAWAREQISLDQMKARAHYAFALTLAAVATERYRTRLIKRAIAVQSSLPENTNNKAPAKTAN